MGHHFLLQQLFLADTDFTSVADPDPRSGTGTFWIPGSGIRIRDEQPGSYFRKLRKICWVKILKFFDADPGSRWKKFESGIEKNPVPG
jgi:hypothetical protein